MSLAGAYVHNHVAFTTSGHFPWQADLARRQNPNSPQQLSEDILRILKSKPDSDLSRALRIFSKHPNAAKLLGPLYWSINTLKPETPNKEVQALRKTTLAWVETANKINPNDQSEWLLENLPKLRTMRSYPRAKKRSNWILDKENKTGQLLTTIDAFKKTDGLSHYLKQRLKEMGRVSPSILTLLNRVYDRLIKLKERGPKYAKAKLSWSKLKTKQAIDSFLKQGERFQGLDQKAKVNLSKELLKFLQFKDGSLIEVLELKK